MFATFLEKADIYFNIYVHANFTGTAVGENIFRLSNSNRRIQVERLSLSGIT